MELWIRSQDKTSLYKIDNVYIHEDEDKTIHIWTDGINKYLKYYLGGYKSKERALKVLDEIQALLKPKVLLNSGKILGSFEDTIYKEPDKVEIQELNTIVYEMPKE